MSFSHSTPPPNPEISILIPTYRRLSLLERALLHCSRQDIPRGQKAEIVVVDNCPDRSAESLVISFASISSVSVLYFHEPRAGIASARNRAVASAQGKFLVFLDDDECPDDLWLCHLYETVNGDADAAFGPIRPEFEAVPEIMEAEARRRFSRSLNLMDGTEVGSLIAYLGTGNSIYRAETCFGNKTNPFDAKLNSTGGEDIAFLADMVAEGKKLVWAESAWVAEFVPRERTLPTYLFRRRYFSGRVRALTAGRKSRVGMLKTFMWMAVGLLQTIFYGTIALVLAPSGRKRAYPFVARTMGGLGKLLCLVPEGTAIYGRKAAI